MWSIELPIFITVFVLIVWFHTEAFIEYGRLLGLGRFFKLNEFITARTADMSIPSYHIYLNMKYDNFFTRLLVCPFCIGFWIVLAACMAVGLDPVFIPVVYVCSMLLYHVQVILIKYS
jgi:hypothetical protein